MRFRTDICHSLIIIINLCSNFQFMDVPDLYSVIYLLTKQLFKKYKCFSKMACNNTFLILTTSQKEVQN